MLARVTNVLRAPRAVCWMRSLDFTLYRARPEAIAFRTSSFFLADISTKLASVVSDATAATQFFASANLGLVITVASILLAPLSKTFS